MAQLETSTLDSNVIILNSAISSCEKASLKGLNDIGGKEKRQRCEDLANMVIAFFAVCFGANIWEVEVDIVPYSSLDWNIFCLLYRAPASITSESSDRCFPKPQLLYYLESIQQALPNRRIMSNKHFCYCFTFCQVPQTHKKAMFSVMLAHAHRY